MKSHSSLRYTPEGDSPSICACCAQPSQWVGYRPKAGMPYLWFCGNGVCQAQARKLYAMTETDWQGVVDAAVWDGAVEAGRYLDGLGKTDIGALSQEEFFTFMKTAHARTVERLPIRLAAFGEDKNQEIAA